MIRTFIDSGVLVSGARGSDACSEAALAVLEDHNRAFASSIFVRLEVLPKATCYRKPAEIQFYETFFTAVQFWASDVEKMLEDAYQIACQHGLSALDALHVAAALSVGAEELVTTERTNKPMHRVNGIQVLSIFE